MTQNCDWGISVVQIQPSQATVLFAFCRGLKCSPLDLCKIVFGADWKAPNQKAICWSDGSDTIHVPFGVVEVYSAWLATLKCASCGAQLSAENVASYTVQVKPKTNIWLYHFCSSKCQLAGVASLKFGSTTLTHSVLIRHLTTLFAPAFGMGYRIGRSENAHERSSPASDMTDTVALATCGELRNKTLNQERSTQYHDAAQPSPTLEAIKRRFTPQAVQCIAPTILLWVEMLQNAHQGNVGSNQIQLDTLEILVRELTESDQTLVEDILVNYRQSLDDGTPTDAAIRNAVTSLYALIEVSKLS